MKWGIAVAVAFAAALALAFAVVGARAWFVSPMMASRQASGGGGGPATASLSASPSSIASGASSTLTWGSTNAASCASPGSLGNTAIPGFTGAVSGSASVSPTANTTYSIQCGTATASAAVTVTGGGGTVVCDIGPNAPALAGVAATDTATASFTRCAVNSDFNNSFFTTFSNWLAGVNGCGGAASPIWYNVDPGNPSGGASPCANYTMVTDGGNGQILDMRLTSSDYTAGRHTTALTSSNPSGATQQGFTIPTGMYTEWRARTTTASLNAYNSDAAGHNWLIFSPFRYATRFDIAANVPFIEFDFWEVGAHPLAILGNILPGTGVSGTPAILPPYTVCLQPCTGFDPTVMHTYGWLQTTDGSHGLSICFYDDYPGTMTKRGCTNTTSVTTAALTPHEEFQFWVGPDQGSPSSVVGPVEWLIMYIRIFTCPTWNTGGVVCSGTRVTS